MDSEPNAKFEFKLIEKKLSKSNLKRRAKNSFSRKQFEELVKRYDNDHFTSELKNLEKMLQGKFDIKEISSDGNCLYSSIKNQLQINGISIDCYQLRIKATEYIKNNFELYKDILKEPMESYCQKILTDGTFGGEVEINALSKAIPAHIIVYTAEKIYEYNEDIDLKLRIIFFKHKYSANHYDSLIPIQM